MNKPFEYATPTGTAWKTQSGQLVRLYTDEDGRTFAGCLGCLDRITDANAITPARKAQAHARTCFAVQV